MNWNQYLSDYENTIRPGISILVWYFFNVSTLILNKYLYARMSFVYPFSLTAVHMLVCFIGAALVLRVFKLAPYKPLPTRTLLSKIFPLAAIFCVNIVLGNISLAYVPVSFMQTVKSSVPAINVALQALVLQARFSRRVYAAIGFVVLGVAAASLAEINFHSFGFFCALLSSVTTSIQAILSGKLLTGEDRLDSLNIVYYMSPLSFLMLLPYQLYAELPVIRSQWEYWGTSYGFFILLISGIIALGLNVTSFLVVKHTSPLTFTVSGNLKVVLSITISVLIFKNEISFINGLGCALAVFGVYWYNMIRYEENLKEKPISSATSPASPTNNNNSNNNSNNNNSTAISIPASNARD